jgi:hypothetical protein
MPKKKKAPKAATAAVRRLIRDALAKQKERLEREFQTAMQAECQRAGDYARRTAVADTARFLSHATSPENLYVLRTPLAFVVSLKLEVEHVEGEAAPVPRRVLIAFDTEPVDPQPDAAAFHWGPFTGLESVGRDSHAVREEQRERLVSAAVDVFGRHNRHAYLEQRKEPEVQPLTRGSNGKLGISASQQAGRK